MFLKDKKILITGLANKYSIAAGIAHAMHREGASLAFTYQNERMLKNLAPIANELGSNILIECDVSCDDSIKKSFTELKNYWDTFDGFVHSIGFAPADQLLGDFVDVTTREGFKIAHDISSYSFTALAKAAKPMLNDSCIIGLR
jgi:enoyl-[acyl-carrier protein] reductase I